MGSRQTNNLTVYPRGYFWKSPWTLWEPITTLTPNIWLDNKHCKHLNYQLMIALGHKPLIQNISSPSIFVRLMSLFYPSSKLSLAQFVKTLISYHHQLSFCLINNTLISYQSSSLILPINNSQISYQWYKLILSKPQYSNLILIF